MKQEKIAVILNKQREFFDSGRTLPISFRLEMLKKLKARVIEYEGRILAALKSDLGKSEYEGYMCEVGMVLSEISYMIANVPKFAKKQKRRTPLSQFPASSYTLASPYGNTLIMSPWNYPFLLTVGPLANAISAGNTAIVKPSAYSPATSEIIRELIEGCFEEEYISVVTGGREENSYLLSQRFDFVFFTGSTSVGREVLRRCAENLTPAVLELGGKSPCIVDSTAKIALAAKRIVFGKLVNAGQTCVAPDYILVDCKVKNELIGAIIREIKAQYGENPLENESYGRIVNKKHFDCLISLIDKDKTVFGGRYDEKTLKIEPCVLDNVSFSDAVMKEEIFGPIIPILTFRNIDELFPILKDLPKPLAFYYFSEHRENIERLVNKCGFGGGCINDTIIHLATSEMGFGGVGESGMGSYHGKAGFYAFSHEKSIVNKKTWLDLPMRYQPYKSRFEKIIRFFLK